MTDDVKFFSQGSIIFQQGESGGDLFLIQEGKVDIFTDFDHREVVLETMSQGEVLGVLTCLTGETRLASARARTDVVAKVIKHETLKKVVESLPEWMKTVLREFTIRLTKMDRKFSEMSVSNEKLGDNQVSPVFLASQVAGAFAAFGEFYARDVDDRKMVDISEMLAKLEGVIGQTKEELEKIVDVFVDSGLIKVDITRDTKKKQVSLDVAKKLSWFAQFVRESKSGKKRKIVKMRFDHKEKLTYEFLVKHAVKNELKLEEMVRVPMSDLQESIKKFPDKALEESALDKGKDLDLIVIEGEGPAMKVGFVPSTLGRTMASVQAIHTLEDLHLKDSQTEKK